MAQTQTSKLSTADCRSTARSSGLLYRLLSNLLCYIVLLGFFAGSCSSINGVFGTRSKKLTYEELAATYNQIILEKSLTLDVVPRIQRSKAELGPLLAGTELLSRSENIVASLGQNKDGYKTWFNMATFNEYRLTAVRKAFFLVNDKETSLGTGTSRSLVFDCEMVLPRELLLTRYISESSKQIALLKYIISAVRKDIDELGADTNASGQSNQMLSVCGMLLNQTFETILRRFDSSPVLATRLNEPGGVRFDHISFNQGAIRMIIESDIAAIHIRLGALADTF